MRRRIVKALHRDHLEGVGWMAILVVAACCGLTGLLAAGVATVVLWSVGLGLIGAVVGVVALAWLLRRARSHSRAIDDDER